ncbi:hypothetical protein F2P81_019459 [Scophthalmus maximus]|uniref:Uncharacterized protein n=1 Tax=Scophthalmus maximus TaxID=52904 RepID=A0A6A4SCQ5_SCOMX|nr:hypothetical protein F2P81_019459 [Scophthalmus maximus]
MSLRAVHGDVSLLIDGGEQYGTRGNWSVNELRHNIIIHIHGGSSRRKHSEKGGLFTERQTRDSFHITALSHFATGDAEPPKCFLFLCAEETLIAVRADLSAFRLKNYLSAVTDDQELQQRRLKKHKETDHSSDLSRSRHNSGIRSYVSNLCVCEEVKRGRRSFKSGKVFCCIHNNQGREEFFPPMTVIKVTMKLVFESAEAFGVLGDSSVQTRNANDLERGGRCR